MFPKLQVIEEVAGLESHPLLNIKDALFLRGDIKQYYHLGNELGQGSYGIVKVSQRNCSATNQMYLSKNNRDQMSYAIKQVLIPELDS